MPPDAELINLINEQLQPLADKWEVPTAKHEVPAPPPSAPVPHVEPVSPEESAGWREPAAPRG